MALDHTITKAELFQKLRDHWNTFDSTSEVIDDLDKFSSILFALELGEINEDIPKGLEKSLLRFHRSNLPSSIYTFIFSCVESVKNEEQSLDLVVDAFDVIEGFLVRRAVCGIEPSGLHAVFKGMYRDITKNSDYDKKVCSESVSSEIQKRSTVPWPDDDRFKEQLKVGNLYSRRIKDHVLFEFELHSGGESPSDKFWVEHVLPQTLTTEWREVFNDEAHNKWKDTFANLIPLTAEMNGKEGQNPYSQKKDAYKGSIFSSTRNFSEDYKAWDVKSIESRANKLSEWGVTRWPKSLL